MVADALEVAGIAAHCLVMTVGTVRCSIAHETFVNALACIATKNEIKMNVSFASKKKNKSNLPELVSTARWAVELVALVGTVVGAIASPRRRDAVFVMVDAIAVQRRGAREVIRATGRLCSARPAIFQQHQPMRTRTDLVGLAVVLRSNADVRAFIFLRHASVVFDDLRLRMPHGHNVGEVRVFLLNFDALTGHRDLFELELLIEPVNDVREGGDRQNLINNRVDQGFTRRMS